MKIIQKAAVSLIIALILFAGFMLLAFSSLFDIIETNYYNKKVIIQFDEKLNEIDRQISEYKAEKNTIINEISNNSSIKKVFFTNQSREDIFQQNNLMKKLKNDNIYFKYLRIFDDDGKIHFSSNENDINTKDDFKISYKTLENAVGNEEIQKIKASGNNELLFLEEPGFISIKNDLNDNFGIRRGSIQLVYSSDDLYEFLKKKNLIDNNDKIALIGSNGLVVNLFNKNKNIVSIIRENWLKNEYEKIKYIYEDESGKEYALLTYKGDKTFTGIVLLKEIFQINQYYRYILLIISFFVFNILTFLLFNIKQDKISVISDRIKRFQIKFLIEYLDEKHEIDWKRWKKELKNRKEEVRKEFKKGIRGLNKKQEEEVNLLIDKSWDEIIALLAGRFQEPAVVKGASVEIGNIDEIVKKILQTELKYTSQGKSPGAVLAPKLNTPEPVAVESVDEAEEIEELDELEEIGEEEALETPEPVAVEALDEAEETEELDELEEIGEEEALETPEPVAVEALDEAEETEELDELEEIGEEEALETPEPVAVEALDEAEETEELDELEEIGEEEALETPEPVAVEALDEAEETEELDELEEIGEEEALETPEPVAVEALDEAEETEELDELEEISEEEALETPEPVAVEALDEAEETEELDELEEIGEEEALETPEPVAVEALDEAEETEELDELEEISEEEALETPESVAVEALDEAEETEELDELEEISEEEALETPEPVAVEALDEAEETEELDELEEIGEEEALETPEPVAVEALDETEEIEELASEPVIELSSEKLKNIAEEIISVETIKSVITAAEKIFKPLTEPETKEESEKLNSFRRRMNLEEGYAELEEFKEDKALEWSEIKSEEELIEEIEALEDDITELEELEELEDGVTELEEIPQGELSLRDEEEIEELEAVKVILPLEIEREEENVEYLEPVKDVDISSEVDVDYISGEWIKEYNKTINIMDNVFEEIRKLRMEELTGFAEMAVLEEIKEIEYNELKNLTLNDKITLLKKEKLLEITDIGKFAQKYRDLRNIVVDKDGVFEISSEIYKNRETPADSEFKKAVDDVIGKNGSQKKGDDFTISGFFAKTDVDLPLFEMENNEVNTQTVEIDPDKMITEEYGFDLDMYVGNYSGESSIAYMKALLKISRSVNSIYGGIIVQDETRFYPDITSGLNQTENLLIFRKKDVFYQEILSQKKVFYLKTGINSVEEIDSVFSDEDKVFMKSILFMPVKYKNKQAYLFLSPDKNIFSFDDIVEKVHNLHK